MRRHLVDIFVALVVVAIFLLMMVLVNIYPEYRIILIGLLIVIIIALIVIGLIIKKQF